MHSSSLRIVHIGTADNRGGAARAAFQLHEGLRRLGHDSRMLVGQRFEQRTEIERIGFPKTLGGRILNRLILELETRTGLQYLIQPHRRAFLSHRFLVSTDIIHLHNLHGNFFPITILPRLSKISPMVWTLHDTWSMTGHCAYNYDCDRWMIGCGKCPILSEHPKISVDTTALLWRVKDYLYRRSNICVVAPSRWLTTMARTSPLLGRFDTQCIPYGIDTQGFHPVDRATARVRLGLPVDALVTMIILLPEDKRKGREYFIHALHKLKSGLKPWLLVVGSRGLLNGIPQGIPVHEVGYVETTEVMNLCYSAADVFVLPTLADNLPLSLLEALAAGTPSVAFNTGGVSDIVRHKDTGYLANYKDSDDLALGIEMILTDDGLRAAMRLRCREVAVAEYSLDLQARRFEDLYRKVIQSSKKARQGIVHPSNC